MKSLQHAHESLLGADFDINMITLEEIIKTTYNKLNTIQDGETIQSCQGRFR